MKDFNIEERVQRAINNFYDGFNCAQSVFLAYSDIFELDLDTAKKMSVSFGGGMGKMREVCGTVSAMSMLAGFRYPVMDAKDQDARTKNYAIIQKMAALFKEQNNTIICRELLGRLAESDTPAPELRTNTYYEKRPCAQFVEESARIAGKMLKGELE